MALLFNYAQGTVEDVPEESITGAVASGQYQFRKKTTIPVLAPDGEETTIDAADASEAFANGYVYLTNSMSKDLYQQRIEASRQEVFGGTAGELTAAGLGALSGATMGLSDVALGAAGLGEAVRGFEEVNPKAAMAGEIAGAVGGLATGLSPVSAVSKLGTKVSAKIATKASPIVTRMAAAGAGSAVEGALYSAGQSLGELALGDPSFTAESAIASVGLGGVFGGAFGAAAPAVGKAWSEIKEISKELLKPVAERAGGAAAHLAGKAVSVGKGLSGSAKEDVDRIFSATPEGMGLRRRLVQYFDNPEQFNADTTKTVKILRDVAEEQNTLSLDVRKLVVDRLDQIDTPNIRADAQQGAVFSIDKIDNVLKEMSADPLISQATTKKLKGLAQETLEKMNSAESTKDVFNLMYDLRKTVDDEFKLYKSAVSASDKRAKDLLITVRSELKDFLANKDLFKSVGSDWEKMQGALDRFIGVKKQFQKAVYSDTMDSRGLPIKAFDENKVVNVFRNPANKSKEHAAINDFIDALDNLKKQTSEIAENSGLNPDDLLMFEGRNILSAIDQMREYRGMMLTLNRLESTTGKSLAGMIYGSVAGAAVSEGAQALGVDVPTSVAGIPLFGLAGMLISNPKFLAKQIARLENGNVKLMGGINAAASKLASAKIPGIVNSEALKTVKNLSIANMAQQMGASDAISNPLEALRSRVSELLTSADALDSNLSDATPFLDRQAPMTYAAMNQTSRKALEFINSKLPQQPMVAGMVRPLDIRLPKSEEIKLSRSINAAMNPASILKEIELGMVYPETVEAVKTVYPAFYRQMSMQIMDAVTQPEAKISTKTALVLSRITGLPTNMSLANAMSLQSSWMTDERQGETFRPSNILKWANDQVSTATQQLAKEQ